MAWTGEVLPAFGCLLAGQQAFHELAADDTGFSALCKHPIISVAALNREPCAVGERLVTDWGSDWAY